MKSSNILVYLPILLLLGCNQSSSTQTLSVNSVNGSYPLTGIFLFNANLCTYDPLHNLDVRSNVVLDGDIKTTDITSYPSVDASCTGTATHRYKTVSKVSIDGEKSTTWDYSTVPNRDDGSGTLPDPVTASKVKTALTEVSDDDPNDSFTTGSAGSESELLLYVDDTVLYSSAELGTVYRGNIFSGVDADGYPLLMDPDPIQYHVQ